jgi:hypothetical protein
MNTEELMEKSRDAEARGLTLDEFLDELGAIAIGFSVQNEKSQGGDL